MTRRLVTRALALASLVVLAACGDDGSSTSSTVASSSTSSASTATDASAPTTSGTTITPTTTRAAEPTTLLVAHRDGIDLAGPAGSVPVLDDRPVEIALPDRSGGIVFQEAVDAYEPVPIEWLPAPGADPELLFAEPDARFITLEDVTEIDGAPTMVFRVARTLANDCPDPDPTGECEWAHHVDHLMIRNLVTGEETNLGAVGSFESSSVRHSFGGPTVATTAIGYADSGLCVVASRSDELLHDPSAERWIGSTIVLRDLSGDPCCHEIAASECSSPAGVGLAVAEAAPDGTAMAVARLDQADTGTGVESLGPPEVVLTDVVTGGETLRAEIGKRDVHPTWIDFDGASVVVGRTRGAERLAPVLVEADGTVTELDIEGRIAIWVDGG